MYDAIIVGARVAGSATALLLAREGLRVLVVDRATFPSDTLSTHQVQLPGVARLAKWGLLDRLVAAGTPPTRRLLFDPGPVALEASIRGSIYSPRRTVLDKILVDAAREAGAEVRENVVVEDLLTDQAGRVTGVRCREKRGSTTTEPARLVVGADGKHSLVATTVKAPRYKELPARTVAYYTYWADVPLDRGEVYLRDQRSIGAWPTNDGLVMTYVGAPARDFAEFRRDPEASLLAALDLTGPPAPTGGPGASEISVGDLGKRVREGRRAERLRGTPDLPNFFRKPYGPGWALVGDAGYVLDPITAQGISDALRDAELLAGAVLADTAGAMARYQADRDRAALPMYDFTMQLAAFGPPRVEDEVLFGALAGRPAEAERFLGVITGAIPMRDYLTPGNLFQVIGARGIAKIAVSKLRQAVRRP
jgi:2-polyprenyl-6-methoxyphenol hydroxylase-like FAD-dependent oxidoreductase